MQVYFWYGWVVSLDESQFNANFILINEIQNIAKVFEKNKNNYKMITL